MTRPGKFFKAGLRTKVLVPVLAVMVLLLTMTVLIVNQHFKQQVWTNSRQELDSTMLRFQHEQIKQQSSLKERFQSLAREPHYLSAFRTDAPTIREQLSQMWTNEMLVNDGIVFVHFMPTTDTVTDKAGPIIQPVSQQVNSAAITAGCYSVMQLARTGEPATDTVRIGDKLCSIVALPIWDATHDQVVGTLAFGEEMGWNVAQELSIGTGGHSCTALLAGNRVIATTLPGTNLLDADLVTLYHQLAGHAAETNAAPRSVVLKDKHYFFSSGNFPSLKGDDSLGYLLFSSYEEQLAALQQTQWLLLVVSLIAIVTGSVIVWYFVQRATAPLIELRDSAEAVGRGDFSRRVRVRSRDECGELAKAFNRMTEDVQSAQTQLQQTVTTLKTTQQQLVQSEKLSAVGEFVAGVAHELNNPLAAVMGFSELLRNANVDEKQKRHLDLIFKSSQRCQKIVQSLLSFARRHQPERKPVSVNLLIEDVLEIVAYQLRSSNVQVTCRLASNLPLVMADGHQVQQVLLNLLNNARQAIEAHQAGGQITITTQARDEIICIGVQDNGPGISPENIQRIFDPFFTTKEVGKGTGLGLSLCYGLIKEHGGNITVTSQPGAGATFTIELPATAGTSAADQAAANQEPVANPQEGAGKKILLVDDEDILLEMVRDDLLRHGYEVVTANHGEAALRELHEHKVDAICCDLKMPGLNGRQLYDWIRSTRPQFARRIIFMTGDVINESLQMFLEQENLTCLNKPFHLRDLREAVKKIAEENGGR
jgi:signal transduction histidine kinase/ActR/RegA family two-component response regulator